MNYHLISKFRLLVKFEIFEEEALLDLTDTSVQRIWVGICSTIKHLQRKMVMVSLINAAIDQLLILIIIQLVRYVTRHNMLNGMLYCF